MTIFGVAISVMVYVVMGATARSLEGMAASTGDPANVDRALEGGQQRRAARSLDTPTVNTVRYVSGVVRDAEGAPARERGDPHESTHSRCPAPTRTIPRTSATRPCAATPTMRSGCTRRCA